VVSSAAMWAFAGLTTIKGFALSRSRFAPVRSFQRRLRDIFLMSRPPLLCEEGNIAQLQFIHTFIDRVYSSQKARSAIFCAKPPERI
jgi:hypothetical protein